jgi:DNA-binding LacI/PurR family transcriptional regulator
MEKLTRRPTVTDVARAAGVSPSSVSRVLNNVPPISAELRHQVEQAVAALGYEHRRPTLHYQGTIAVLLPDTMNGYFHEIALGIEEQAAQYGAVVSLVPLITQQEYIHRLLRWLGRGACEAVIIASGRTLSDEQLAALRSRSNLPIVLINRRSLHPQIPSIHINFADAMYRATRHLLGLGHTRLAFLSGPAGSVSSVEKRRGVDLALSEAGLTVRPELFLAGQATVEWGYQNMNALLVLPEAERPTGIVAFNDLVALGAIHACRVQRVHVPDDISITGFDDIAMAAHANPPLTTISPPKTEIGRLAVRLVHQIRTNGEADVDRYTMMESPLIVRESTAAPPKR